MMTESGLARRMAHAFVAVSTTHTFPVLVGAYSAVLGLFVPSAGGKWIIEAPYMLDAANSLHVHLGWVVQTYNATEALANLIHPFWMLPLLGILNLKARDIVGCPTFSLSCTFRGVVPGVDSQLHAPHSARTWRISGLPHLMEPGADPALRNGQHRERLDTRPGRGCCPRHATTPTSQIVPMTPRIRALMGLTAQALRSVARRDSNDDAVEVTVKLSRSSMGSPSGGNTPAACRTISTSVVTIITKSIPRNSPDALFVVLSLNSAVVLSPAAHRLCPL